jgi:cell division protein FtsL
MPKKGISSPVRLFYIFLIFFTALFYVWQRIQVVRLGYQIDKLRTQLEEQENQNKYLKIQLNNVCALERVEKIAKEKLKMIDPPPENIIYLETK